MYHYFLPGDQQYIKCGGVNRGRLYEKFVGENLPTNKVSYKVLLELEK